MSVAGRELWNGRPIGSQAETRLHGAPAPAYGHAHYGAWLHFRQRVLERIGPCVDPLALWHGLAWAIAQDRHDLVRCLGRLNRKGRRAWQFRVPDGRVFFAVFDHCNDVPVTVLTARQWHEGHKSSVRRLQGREVE